MTWTEHTDEEEKQPSPEDIARFFRQFGPPTWFELAMCMKIVEGDPSKRYWMEFDEEIDETPDR